MQGNISVIVLDLIKFSQGRVLEVLLDVNMFSVLKLNS